MHIEPRSQTRFKPALLTIDDGPSPDMRLKVDFVAGLGIQALWFCTGRALEARPDDAIYAIRRGQVIGNHSYRHRRYSGLTLSQGQQDISRADELIDSIYAAAGEPRPGQFFRFPFGDKGDARRKDFQRLLADSGYQCPRQLKTAWNGPDGYLLSREVDWGWTFDTKDWALGRPQPVPGLETIDKLFARMDADDPKAGLGLNRDGAEVVLIHDHVSTTKHFPVLIQRLLTMGLVFLPVVGQSPD